MPIEIDPEGVEAVFSDCLFKPEELVKDEVPEDAVMVEGIAHKFGFHPGRLEEKRATVRLWLEALPAQFHKHSGGGWSFLQACQQKDGRQWTGFHQRMEQLFALGMGLGFVHCQVPREMWGMFPGGMPYYVIDLEKDTAPCPT